MRIPVVRTVAALGLLSLGLFGCRRTTAFVNADDATAAHHREPTGAACNDVEQQGKAVDLSASHDVAPPASGGAIEDGTYVLTSSVLYTEDKRDGAKLVGMGKVTMVVSGSVSQIVRSSPEGRERRTTMSRVTRGDTATITTTCAPGEAVARETATARYTAGPGAFQLISPSPAGTLVTTYTKVPTSLARTTIERARPE